LKGKEMIFEGDNELAYDDLEAFAIFFTTKVPAFGLIPLFNAVHKIQDVFSVTWYRHEQYQVQMFIVPPNYVIPEHTHPNVDSIELYLGGQIKFSHKGKWTIPEQDLQIPSFMGTSCRRGKMIRVRPNDPHGGIFGEGGGVFMSIQKWLNEVEPHCVSADYVGATMGEHHTANIKFGDAYTKSNLTWKDAASLEESA
jgi:hypothetical protein